MVDTSRSGLIIVCTTRRLNMTMSYTTKQTDTFTQFVKGDDNPQFADRLAKLQEGVQIIMNEQKLKFTHLAKGNARVEYNTGKRYIKMIYMDDGSYSRRVHGFIDRTNGDVLMPAGWTAPPSQVPEETYGQMIMALMP